MQRTLSRIIATTALLSLFSPLLWAKSINDTFPASAGGDLHIKTQVGKIEIDTHSDNTIAVHVDIDGKQEDDFTVEFKQTAKGLNITGKRDNDDGWFSWNNLRVKFRITVPEHYNVDVNTSGGSIEIADLTGNIDAKTSGGSINIGNIEGDVQLHTSGGSITTDAIYGEIDAHTSGGSINVTFAQQPTKNASLHTSGGSIKAHFPDDVSIDIDASTSGGKVTSEFDVSGKIKKQSIKGTINGGGPQIDLHTSGGSVRLIRG